ncbi:hypothetical protein [Aurantiacibacter zhengii]|nr:hypothetical protein [Aurantiacibacter zhengii]
MNRLLNNSLAALAAVVIALTSLSAVTSVPVQQGAAIAAPALA